MGARRHFLPRVEASRWAATQRAATTRRSARICSGGGEGVGGAGLEWMRRASVLSRLGNQHIGSRPAPRLHEEGSHELRGQGFDQGADPGTRGQVLLDEQKVPEWRDVDETGPSCCLPSPIPSLACSTIPVLTRPSCSFPSRSSVLNLQLKDLPALCTSFCSPATPSARWVLSSPPPLIRFVCSFLTVLFDSPWSFHSSCFEQP
uniref:Uncharacterized protein n=1 Tax=Chromera velia CCMP2878 TaxID=1169474 RepID=A0A0K6S8Y8_9ALVE|eukprot:Cvel_26969.t2-p1 / transcript=Cvel_26969.t2 / gene=Cvel_26969 / organism=Chromera_velia_CCMP2878 / gene_product=hypothetical protein / transcript_product=hypothetical protein / location=Cvel_scaffold3290:1636-2244(-) / protein_length=203 / sequence_SO=supercontig / SO=protein_coding / is_pseudo=false